MKRRAAVKKRRAAATMKRKAAVTTKKPRMAEQSLKGSPMAGSNSQLLSAFSVSQSAGSAR